MNEVKYAVLWMQGKGLPTMHPVSAINVDAGNGVKGVAYSRKPNLDDALRFNSSDEASAAVRTIRELYGESQDLAVIQDPPAKGEWTQERLDAFLPTWAWQLKRNRLDGIANRKAFAQSEEVVAKLSNAGLLQP
ncbi:MAG: hypothetical protein LCH73_02835 [Proteobacteria bacterium]|nr:hypothetical protein [Pseudomonadota bacterium]